MYRSIYKIIRIYWRDYGGFRDWIASPFVHIGLMITTFYGFGAVDIDWRYLSLSSLPTMLGFSLAAYTITFSLMGSALHRALSAAIDKNSGIPLIRLVNSTFFHVVLFQTIALSFSIVTKGDFFSRILGGNAGFGDLESLVLGLIVYGGDLVGCFLSVYAVLLLFSVAVAMFRLGRLSTSSPLPLAANSNSEGSSAQADMPDVTKSWRFGVVRFVAKCLRLYK